MVRAFWLILAAAAVASTWLWRHPLPAVDAGTSVVEGPRAVLPEPEVEVRHEIVRLSPPPSAPSIRDQRPAVEAVPRSAPRVVRARRDGSLLDKARRTVVGDGRYRPEPFPRVR